MSCDISACFPEVKVVYFLYTKSQGSQSFALCVTWSLLEKSYCRQNCYCVEYKVETLKSISSRASRPVNQLALSSGRSS